MNYFTTRETHLFPSFTISAKEREKPDRFLLLLDRSKVGEGLETGFPAEIRVQDLLLQFIGILIEFLPFTGHMKKLPPFEDSLIQKRLLNQVNYMGSTSLRACFFFLPVMDA